jgi:flagellar assembly protein FliH
MSSKVLKGGRITHSLPSWQKAVPLGNCQVHGAAKAAALQNPAESGGATPQTEPAESYQRGYRDGEAAARAALGSTIERLAQSIDHTAGLRARLRKEAEGDLLRLAVAISRRILHREISVDPEALSGLIMAALEKLKAHEVQRVRAHPDIETALRSSLEHLAAGRNVQIIADRSRQPGDLVFETERGSLDASIETQLQEIERGLADRLRSRR